jgi:hypothetical protein
MVGALIINIDKMFNLLQKQQMKILFCFKIARSFYLISYFFSMCKDGIRDIERNLPQAAAHLKASSPQIKRPTVSKESARTLKDCAGQKNTKCRRSARRGVLVQQEDSILQTRPPSSHREHLECMCCKLKTNKTIFCQFWQGSNFSKSLFSHRMPSSNLCCYILKGN